MAPIETHDLRPSSHTVQTAFQMAKALLDRGTKAAKEKPCGPDGHSAVVDCLNGLQIYVQALAEVTLTLPEETASRIMEVLQKDMLSLRGDVLTVIDANVRTSLNNLIPELEKKWEDRKEREEDRGGTEKKLKAASRLPWSAAVFMASVAVLGAEVLIAKVVGIL